MCFGLQCENGVLWFLLSPYLQSAISSILAFGSFARSCIVKPTFLCKPYFLLFNSRGLFPQASSTFRSPSSLFPFSLQFPDTEFSPSLASRLTAPVFTSQRLAGFLCSCLNIQFFVVSIHTNCFIQCRQGDPWTRHRWLNRFIHFLSSP